MKPDPLLIVSGIFLTIAAFLPWFAILGVLPGGASPKLDATFDLFHLLILLTGLLILANGIRAFSRFWTFAAAWTALLIGLLQLALMYKFQQIEPTASWPGLQWLSQLQVKYTKPSPGLFLIFGGALFGLFGVVYAKEFVPRDSSRTRTVLKVLMIGLITGFVLFYPNLRMFMHLQKAQSLEAVNDTEAAQESYRLALSTPVLINLPLISGQVYESYGLYCYAHGKFDEAVPVLERALNHDTNNWVVLKTLGLIHYQQNEADQALFYLERAYDIRYDDADLLDALSRLYIDRGLWGMATTTLQHLSRLQPDNPEVTALLGKLYLKQGDYAQARLYLERALQHNNNLMEAHVDLGFALLHQQEFVSSLQHFKRATELGWQQSQIPDKMKNLWQEYIAPFFQ